MRLHAANLAIMAGANTDEVKIICELLKDEEHITLTRAKELLNMIRSQKTIRQDYSLMNNSL
jgi:hydroxymethylglutaryl-CoA reductase